MDGGSVFRVVVWALLISTCNSFEQCPAGENGSRYTVRLDNVTMFAVSPDGRCECKGVGVFDGGLGDVGANTTINGDLVVNGRIDSEELRVLRANVTAQATLIDAQRIKIEQQQSEIDQLRASFEGLAALVESRLATLNASCCQSGGTTSTGTMSTGATSAGTNFIGTTSTRATVADNGQLDLTPYLNVASEIHECGPIPTSFFHGGASQTVSFRFGSQSNFYWGPTSNEPLILPIVPPRPATDVFTAANTFWGDTIPAHQARITFTGSAGANYTFHYLGNENIRDYRQNTFTNLITDTAVARNMFECLTDRLDVQHIALPEAFRTQNLVRIRIDDSGPNGQSRMALAAVTIVHAASTSHGMSPGAGATSAQTTAARSTLRVPTTTGAVSTGSTIFAWGANMQNQLGDGTNVSRWMPVPVVRPPAWTGKTVTHVATGGQHSLASLSDGSLYSWGWNSAGQIGDSSTGNNRSVPTAVIRHWAPSLTVLALAAGHQHSIALLSDHTLYAWGSGQFGQLGNNKTANSSFPIMVIMSAFPATVHVSTIAAGYDHSMALLADGSVYSWGRNDAGQLGDNSTIIRVMPTRLVQPVGWSSRFVTAIAAGAFHSLALLSDGTAWRWGWNNLGTDSTALTHVPTRVLGLSGNVTAIAAGLYHSMALLADGSLYCWGMNSDGQLGDNTVTSRALPTIVTSGSWHGDTVTSIAAGNYHSMAVVSDGTLFAWGQNLFGQIGDNSNSVGDRLVPTAVVAPTDWQGRRISRIAAGTAHSLVLLA